MHIAKQKTMIRNTVAHLPLFVQCALTQILVSRASGFIMTEEERRQCRADENAKRRIIKQRKQNFPGITKKQARLIEKVFAECVPYNSITGEQKDRLVDDMYYCWFAFGFPAEEYAYYNLEEKDAADELRDSFVSDKELLAFRLSANNFTESVYADKATAFEKLKPWCGRDGIVIEGKKDEAKFYSFIDKHRRFVQKVVFGSKGEGIRLIDIDEYTGGGTAYFQSALKQGKTLLEEPIVQNQTMADFNKDSINTVRIITFYTKEGIITPFGFFRTGRKGSFVDNAAKGGILSAIDTATGIVCSDGWDKFNNRYKTHPESERVFKGFQIPKWNEALQICTEIAKTTPDLKFLGFDLAYTDSHGWTVVEVNTSSTFLQQAAMQKGVRKQFLSIANQMDLLVPFKARK